MNSHRGDGGGLELEHAVTMPACIASLKAVVAAARVGKRVAGNYWGTPRRQPVNGRPSHTVSNLHSRQRNFSLTNHQTPRLRFRKKAAYHRVPDAQLLPAGEQLCHGAARAQCGLFRVRDVQQAWH